MAKHQKNVIDGLLDIFVKQKVFDTDKARAVDKLFHDRSKPSFVQFLLEEDLVSRGDILNALSEFYKVPAYDVVGHLFDHELLRKFPKQSMLRYVYIPLEQDQNMLIVITNDPNNEQLWDEIGSYVSYTLQFMVGIEPDITDAVKEFYDRSPAVIDIESKTVGDWEEEELELDRIMKDWDEE